MGGGAREGRGSGDSGTGSKEFVRDIVMRVRSSRERDIRGWGFFTGEGVALPMELMIWSARTSSGSRTGGSKFGIGGSERYSGDALPERRGDAFGDGDAFCSARVTVVLFSGLRGV